MKRYDPCMKTEDYTYERYAGMEECSYGSWVRYESHKQTVIDLNKAQDRIIELKAQIEKLENK
jgi:hypothetical protein